MLIGPLLTRLDFYRHFTPNSVANKPSYSNTILPLAQPTRWEVTCPRDHSRCNSSSARQTTLGHQRPDVRNGHQNDLSARATPIYIGRSWASEMAN